MRFKVEDETYEFCNPANLKLKVGVNTVLFSELSKSCWGTIGDTSSPTAVTAQSKLIRLVWQVVTNTTDTVPYDFCISNLRALRK